MPVRATCALALAALSLAASGSSGSDGGAVMHPERPRFIVQTPALLGPGGEPELRVQVVVPYTELLFEKKPGGGYAARVELVIILYDGKDQIGGDLWSREVEAADAPATVDPKAAFSQEERFTVPGGKLRVKVEVKDAASGREGTVERKIEVPAFGDLPLSMSDLRFGSCDAATGPDAFEPSCVRARFGGDPLPPVCIHGEIYARNGAAGAGGYRVEWRVRDDKGREKSAGTLEVAADSARARFSVEPDLRALSLGRYEFLAELKHGGRTVRRTIPFEMDESRLSLTAGFSDLVEMAGYIGSSGEISRLEDALPSERPALWEAFWKKRDPSPGTPENEAKQEFFRRVQHANEAFGSANLPGWRSDRGVVYIRLGEPDQIESRPMNATDPPYEVWHYYAMNRSYVFADYDGFGRYTLVRTLSGGR